jgi:hypothetical protein
METLARLRSEIIAAAGVLVSIMVGALVLHWLL